MLVLNPTFWFKIFWTTLLACCLVSSGLWYFGKLCIHTWLQACAWSCVPTLSFVHFVFDWKIWYWPFRHLFIECGAYQCDVFEYPGCCLRRKANNTIMVNFSILTLHTAYLGLNFCYVSTLLEGYFASGACTSKLYQVLILILISFLRFIIALGHCWSCI